MKFRVWMVLLLVVIGASYAYHRHRAIEPPSLPAQVTSTDESKTSIVHKTNPVETENIKKINNTVNMARGGVATDPRYTQKPKDMSVEFEMVNGYAVAYGDSLLGKPLSGFSEQRGIAEMNHPKYWEGGVIPYVIKPEVTHTERIKQAIDYFNQNTTVKFVTYEGQPDAIVFEKGAEHCYSYLGKIGGLQPVIISEKCGTQQIMHELMHVLGFVHEQSRTDRDQYVQIIWENIEEKYYPQFAMVPEPLMNSYFGSAFDPYSIMMYEPNAFALKPELKTMQMKNGLDILPVKNNLSSSDIDRVNKLYPTVL